MDYGIENDEPIYNIPLEPTELNKFLAIGYSYTNLCEDQVYAEESRIHRIVSGSFDGFSSGTDSHFASALVVKILRRVFEDIEYGEFGLNELFSPEEFCREIIKTLFYELKEINQKLRLKYDEVLTTVLISVYDK